MAEPRALPRLTEVPLAPIPSGDPIPSGEASHDPVGAAPGRADKATELSMRRTGMSIHRTRMSADRTLMSVLRTSLSLIGFGFTLHEAFKKAFEAGAIDSARSARNFGLALILLGMLLLVGGIVRHVQFAVELRQRRHEMVAEGLVHGESAFPISVTLISAVVLLLLGLAAVVSVVWPAGFLG